MKTTPPSLRGIGRFWHEPLRRRVVGVIAGPQGPTLDYDTPPGDAGLFGPDSVTWRIHSDFPGMISGGICALMLQTLQPHALAGVWDHSNFRDDLLGRLRRTTAFVSGTSFAPRAVAETLIAQVKTIHSRVHGTAPDGQPYTADDPELLTWVHVTEMASFLAGYQRYHRSDLAPAWRDRYFDETARVAEALGARGVPRSAQQIEAYFTRLLPTLQYSERSREVLRVLENVDLQVPGNPALRSVMLGAGAALLPDWACALMGRGRLRRQRDRIAARSLRLAAPTLRAALANGIAARACRRMGLQPALLARFPDEPA
ncbi:oxygenase MpaB family protein [Solimonas terrae]|uniref:DUF2236 domain-containing protein n=1 Tax=Solimonas terrae TaxID=1396819 RepID=A0A6M2BTL0_9GAMM|nr:oxygenase MpaB family protein [Solimonas terrae]NGY06002.1 DUF2236 domain-containing protein [Solimonas terrae]